MIKNPEQLSSGQETKEAEINKFRKDINIGPLRINVYFDEKRKAHYIEYPPGIETRDNRGRLLSVNDIESRISMSAEDAEKVFEFAKHLGQVEYPNAEVGTLVSPNELKREASPDTRMKIRKEVESFIASLK